MAIITSTTSGNFADGGTWVGGVAPASSDTFVVASGHTVTVAADATSAGGDVGNGGTLVLAAKLTMTGVLTIAGNSSGSLTFGPGSELALGANLALNCVKIRSTATSGNWAKITGSGNIVNGVAGAFPSYNKQDIELQYVSVQVTGSVLFNVGLNLGTQTPRLILGPTVFVGNSQLRLSTTYATRDTLLKLEDFAMIDCGAVDVLLTSAAGQASNVTVKRGVVSSTGAKNTFTLWGCEGVIPQDCVFDNYTCLYNYAPVDGLERNVHIMPSAAASGTDLVLSGTVGLPYTKNSYFFAAGPNEHCASGSQLTEGCVFDTVYGNTDVVVRSPSATSTIFRNNVSLGSAKCISIASSGEYNNVTIEHNTLYGVDPEIVSALLFAHGQATGNFNVRSNNYSGANAMAINVVEAYAHTVAYAGFNNWHGVTTAYDPVDLTITDGTANDISPAVDPQFVDASRNFKTYYTHKTSTAWNETDARAMWRAVYGWNPTTKCLDGTASGASAADIIAWVRAGFAPTNSALQNAGHDSVTIGAVEYVSAQSAPTLSGQQINDSIRWSWTQ